MITKPIELNMYCGRDGIYRTSRLKNVWSTTKDKATKAKDWTVGKVRKHKSALGAVGAVLAGPMMFFLIFWLFFGLGWALYFLMWWLIFTAIFTVVNILSAV